uniref:Uncharacterized protein n=1 Tax=Pinguiococcus pyrenoidosus TaxID=172671 RepID=A0A6U0VLX7_9STRA|mmetsp:Transcript_596/g.2181  ORF Transcript_596/g.2181 Transcript_596/m.2181 type:complete len:687 (+) Transcript_596:74-2134(+)|eukprot:scaffold1954_cov268-Pinguiococcus_pyrenoidosus.AAC.259
MKKAREDADPEFASFLAAGELAPASVAYPLLTKGDADAFIALFSNNVATLLVMVSALRIVSTQDIIFNRVVPGVGLSMLFGNVYYAWMARRAAQRLQRVDVCAQPYGINTPGAFAFMFSIVYPAYYSHDGTHEERAEFAWRVAVACNLLCGVLAMGFAFVGPKVRELTPPVALMTSLASVGFAYLLLNQLLDVYAEPIAGLLPLTIVFAAYFGKVKFGKVPSAVIALLLGTALGWATRLSNPQMVEDAVQDLGLKIPVFPIWEIFSSFDQVAPYISIVVPVAITVAVGTIQCVESAAQAGDEFPLRESMASDGFGTIVGALFGSVFGMTVYTGHPAFKSMGGRQGYSICNALAFLVICMSGAASVVLSVVINQSVQPIIVYVGLVIGSDVLEMANPRHYPAILLGIVPSISEWGYSTLGDNVGETYSTYFHLEKGTTISYAATEGPCADGFALEGDLCSMVLDHDGSTAEVGYEVIKGINYQGLVSLGSGGLLVSIIMSTVLIYVVDRKFMHCVTWSLFAAVLSLFGIIHSSEIGFYVRPEDQGWRFTVGYVLSAALFFILRVLQSVHGLKWVKEPILDNALDISVLNPKQVLLRDRAYTYSPSPQSVADGPESHPDRLMLIAPPGRAPSPSHRGSMIQPPMQRSGGSYGEIRSAAFDRDPTPRLKGQAYHGYGSITIPKPQTPPY